MFVLITLITFVSAQDTLGVYRQGDCIDIIQVCSSCTYVNISSIVYPDTSLLDANVSMTKTTTEFRHRICNTTMLGTYLVYGYGDLDGELTTFGYDFRVSTSGSDFGGNELPMVVALGIVAFFFLIFAFNLGEEHFLLKLVLIFLSLVTILVIPNILVVGDSSSSGITLLKIVTWCFRIFIIYLSLHIFINWAKQNKKILDFIDSFRRKK